jgi:hypothetical protein
MTRQTLKYLTLIISMVLVAACSQGPMEQGPGDPVREVCLNVETDDESAELGYPASATVGFRALINTGEESAVIDSVTLVEPTGLSIIEPWIAIYPDWPEYVQAASFGALGGYFPALESEWWSETLNPVPAVDAEIRSAEVTNDAFVLVLGLQLDPGAEVGTADAVDVEYTANGAPYSYRIKTRIELASYPKYVLGGCELARG